MDDTDRFGRGVDALGHRYRRRLLVALLDHNPQDDDDAQDAERALGIEGGDDALIETQLFHHHLPKLEDLGYIAWDRETGEIRKGPDWEEIEPLLQLLRDHEEELPDGWL